MHHYVAFLWNPEDSCAAHAASRMRGILEQRATGWVVLTTASGFAAYARARVDTAMRVYVLPDATGIIIGRLFSNDAAGHATEIPLSSAREICSSGGRHLLENFWGNYVAIIRDAQRHTHYVLRDCSGRIPCYYAKDSGVYIFFSSLQDVTCLGLRLTMDDRYLASMILRHRLHLRDTALNEVREVLAGDCVALSHMGAKQYSLWRPHDFATNDVVDEYPVALSKLKDATEAVIVAWGSVYDRILLYLSGGLDSAIVLGCLTKLGFANKVTCLNHFIENSRADERRYARAAAEAADAPLVELPLTADGRTFVDRIKALPFQPKPDISFLARTLVIDDVNRVADEYGCDTVWTGQGGDHIFLQAPHPYGAADYLLQHKFPSASAIYDSAILDRTSVWSVLSTSIGHILGIRASRALLEEFHPDGSRFLTALAITNALDRPCLPWSEDSEALPPGKGVQVRDMADLLNRHRPLVGQETAFEQHPLISQPLLETALKLPTYALQRGGRQRAMAREAFADRVPNCILEREDKGDTTDHVRALLRGSAPFQREILLDGVLVSRGLLDRSALEKVFVHCDTYRTSEMLPLLDCVAAEVWARSWVLSASASSVNSSPALSCAVAS